jgi:hypothetical protein
VLIGAPVLGHDRKAPHGVFDFVSVHESGLRGPPIRVKPGVIAAERASADGGERCLGAHARRADVRVVHRNEHSFRARQYQRKGRDRSPIVKVETLLIAATDRLRFFMRRFVMFFGR